MNTIRQGNKRIARILTSLLYSRSSGGTFYNQESIRQINSQSILPPPILVVHSGIMQDLFLPSQNDKVKDEAKKQTTPLLNVKTLNDRNSKRKIGDRIYTMDATKNPVIFQLRNQNNEVIKTTKMSDVFKSKNKDFKQLSAPPKNSKIIYSNEPVINNIIRSTMKLQPMSQTDYDADLRELELVFKFFTTKEPPFDDSDLQTFSRVAKDFYEIIYSDQILIPGSRDDDDLMSLGII